MSVVVGTLTIDLRANTASFSKSMDKMSHLSAKTANDVKRSLQMIATAGLAMGTAIATGTIALIKSAINSADRLDELAQSAGTTTETLSALGYVARFSSLSTEDLAATLVKLSKSAFAAQNGNDVLARTFHRLKIDVTDGNGHLRDSGVIFEELAPKFSGMADGAGKTALAVLLLGKSGATAIPFLNQLGESGGKLTKEAKQLGLVVGGDTARAAAIANDNLDKLKSLFNGIANSLLATTIPAIVKLTDRLIEVAKEADIPDLGKSFGTTVAHAIDVVGKALEFAVKHARALKIALEALIAIQVAKIAIPVIAEAFASGALAAGVGKLTLSLLGLSKLIPVLARFGTWLVYTTRFIALLASSEGIAAAATYVFGGAIAFLSSPIVLVAAAIAALAGGLYYFRDAEFGAVGETYRLRDALVALWEILTFQEREGEKTFGAVALRIRKEREAADAAAAAAVPKPPPPPKLPPPDTDLGGNEKRKPKDYYLEEFRRLDALIEKQEAYLSVLDATPDKIQAVMSALEASAIIDEINVKLAEDKRAQLTDMQVATIKYKVSVVDSLTALHEFGKDLVGQQKSAEVSILQTVALAAAHLQGESAMHRAAVTNAILGLTYNKTAEQLRTMEPEVVKLTTLLMSLSSAERLLTTNRDIAGLKEEIATRKITNAGAGQFVEVQRLAALAVKSHAINQQIATETDREALAALEEKRRLIIEVTKAEWAEADAQASIALRSPLENYQEELNALIRQSRALRISQGDTLTYAQSLVVAAKAQDIFNQATDETVNLLLRFGGAKDGITAFFLDMQKNAKTTAQIIYQTLHSAFDKVADNLTELITGGKADFAQMFKDIGKEILNSTIRKGLQEGLGVLGKALGIKGMAGALAGKPDGTRGNPLWVKMADDAGLKVEDKRAIEAGGAVGGILGGVFQFLGGLFGNGAGGSTESVTSVFTPMASGGPVSADRAYLVGENGPEILSRTSGTITSNAASRRMLEGVGAASNHYYSIDARGTDPVLTEQRTRAAIMAAHNSAVGTSVQVSADRMRRIPGTQR